jgi:hypothetical protein
MLASTLPEVEYREGWFGDCLQEKIASASAALRKVAISMTNLPTNQDE